MIELRIHGVSGTPAENMLDTPAVVQVAGDDIAGFWRPLVPHPLEPGAPGRERVLEGYRWGGLTSRAAVRALWVLLAPFALVNAAGAMHIRSQEPATEYRGMARGLEGVVVRLLAVALTVMLVLATFVAAVDIVGWQGGPEGKDPGILRADWLETPAQRVAVLALVPVVLLLVLWWLGRNTYKRYEKSEPAVNAAALTAIPRDEAAPEVRTPLQQPNFWSGAVSVAPHQSVHLAAGLSFIALLLGIVLTRAGGEGDALFVWPPAVVLALSILMCAITKRPNAIAKLLLAVAAMAVAALAIYTYWCADLGKTSTGPLPGSADAVTTTFLVQLALILALVGFGFVGWLRHHKREHMRLLGTGTACVSLCAFVIGAAFSAGVILRVADLVGEPRPKAELAELPKFAEPIVTPLVMTWAARWIPLALLLILVLAVVVLVYVRTTRSKHSKPDVSPWSRRKKLANMISWARLTDEVDVILGGVVGIIGVSVGLAVFSTFRGDDTPPPGWLLWEGWPTIEKVGTFIAAGFAVGLLFVISRSFTQEGLRRKVGVLWDVATFWPRQVHPLGPPSYGERAVPEYALRATYFRDDDVQCPQPGFEPSDVVMSAHSQGSVIAVAALLQMSDTSGMALLSYGSPLRRLYRAYFPTYFGDPALDEVFTCLQGRWQHLTRDTDPIGGPACYDPSDPEPPDDRVDVIVNTPPEHRPGDTADPIEGHSNYPREPAYKEALELLDEMLQAPAEAAR